MLSERSPKDVWLLSDEYLEGAMELGYERFLVGVINDVWRVFGGHNYFIWKMSDWVLEDFWNVTYV